MFLRFVVGSDGEDHRQLTGLFAEARLLRDRGALTTYEAELLQSTYDWFNEHLPRPPFRSAGWSREAVSWFKDSALTPIHQMRTLAALLESHDMPVRVLRSKHPGKVLYEDEYQVVVQEWKQL